MTRRRPNFFRESSRYFTAIVTAGVARR